MSVAGLDTFRLATPQVLFIAAAKLAPISLQGLHPLLMGLFRSLPKLAADLLVQRRLVLR